MRKLWHFSFKILLVTTLGISTSGAMASATLPTCDALKNTYLGQNGWIFEDWEMQDSFSLTAVKEYKQLQESLRSRGVQLVALPIPSRPYAYIDMVDRKVYPNLKFSKDIYKRSWINMIDLAKQSGINIVDIRSILENFGTSKRGEKFFYNGDHHWTTSGAQAAAQAVSQYILNFSSKNKIPISYGEKSLIETAGKDYSGSFNYHYIVSCKAKLENLKTYSITIKSSEDSLLGDDIPDIGIFGDSFGLTEPDNNFAEYLEYYTHAKVVNFSTEGGGFFGAMLGYLAVPSINKNLPKFIVVPAQGWLQNDPFLYKETIATLNLCEKKIEGSGRQVSTPSSNSWVQINYGGFANTAYSVVNLKFDKENSKFTIKFNLKDGSSVKRDVERYFPANYKGSRTDYYIPIPENSNTLSVDIQNKDEKSLSKTIDIQLCKV